MTFKIQSTSKFVGEPVILPGKKAEPKNVIDKGGIAVRQTAVSCDYM